MSSPKRRQAPQIKARGTKARGKTRAKVPRPAKAASDPIRNGGGASAAAARLAADIERGLKGGQPNVLSPEAVQALMAAVCKSYAAQLEAGDDFLPLGQRSGVTPTEIMITASKLLRAGNLQVFELGMWQSWTGR